MSFRLAEATFQTDYDNADRLINDFQNAAMQTKHILYRGIQLTEEKYPTLMHVRKGEKIHNLYRKEKEMLEQFRTESATLLTNAYGSLDLVCAAQHFGIPTRLIDWSYSPLVALYFSLSAAPVKHKDFGYRLLLCDIREQIQLSDFYTETPAGDFDYAASDRRLDFFKGFLNDRLSSQVRHFV